MDLDVRAFFDSVPHDLLLKAVAHHTSERWVLLYIERWLKAPMQMPDGTLAATREGNPARVPDLARVSQPVHALRVRPLDGPGASRAARWSATRTTSSPTATPRNRPDSCGLPSPIGSGPWVSSCTPRRPRSCTAKTRTAEETPEHTSFDFLGYTFRGRLARGPRGYFVSFSPAMSTKASKAKGQQIRAWHLNRRTGTDLSGLAEDINPQVRGWINY